MLHNRLQNVTLTLALTVGLAACSQNQNLGVNPVADSNTDEMAQTAGVQANTWGGQVMGSAVSESELTLIWPAQSGAVEYRVQFTSGFGFKIVTKVPSQDERNSGLVGLDLLNLIPGTTYTLQVKAIGSQGQILAESQLMQARTYNGPAMAPEAPTQLAVGAPKPGQISLTFEDNSLYESGFEILYMDIGGYSFKMQRLTVVGSQSGVDRVSVTVSAPAGGCKWAIWVKALGPNQGSVISNGQQVTVAAMSIS